MSGKAGVECIGCRYQDWSKCLREDEAAEIDILINGTCFQSLPAMTHSEFTSKVKSFLDAHGFTLDLGERTGKFHEEVGEFIRAQQFETPEHERQEAIDCGVTAWCLMLAYGIEDPFSAMLAKLEVAAKRPHYVEAREAVERSKGIC